MEILSTKDLFIVILAGGSGTRFWPLSREQFPKQFLPVFGNRSMFSMTAERSLELAPADKIRIVTISSQMPEVRTAVLESGLQQARILEEPIGRNTAPAIGLAAFDIIAENPEAVIAVFPSDHYIRDRELFIRIIKEACIAAQEGWTVTLGIKPTRPETGYGYIRRGQPLKMQGTGEIFTAAKFAEKPAMETAREYAGSGEYYWNSGIFIFSAAHILEKFKELLPHHYLALEEIRALGNHKENKARYEELYSSMDKISIDYGIMERSDKVAVIPADIGWSDVGSWKALFEILEKDSNGNVIHGDAQAYDTRNSLLWSSGKLVTALGYEDAAIIETADAVLACPLERSQDVRSVAEGLIKKGRTEAVVPRKVDKPWGAYMVLDIAENYQVKWLDIKPGRRLSLQSHECRSEHWTIVAGSATVTRDDEVIEVPQGADVYIPRRTKHRVENRGQETLRIVEVQTGSYLGEDDIVRYEDDYGRTDS
jgi:mannose-1-phosphate guanylyltransferase/mannose-6-phosphate isomerase